MRRYLSIIGCMITMLVSGGCLPPAVEHIDTRAVELAAPTAPIEEPTLGFENGSSALSRQFDLSGYSYIPQDERSLVSLPAEGILDLTLEQAVFSALERNRALTVEQFKPLIEGTFVETERALFDPVLFARGRFESYRDRSLDSASDRFFSIDGSRSLLEGGIRKRFQTGTDVSLDLSLSEVIMTPASIQMNCVPV